MISYIYGYIYSNLDVKSTPLVTIDNLFLLDNFEYCFIIGYINLLLWVFNMGYFLNMSYII